MSIIVTCPGCRKSFKVSDKFAGQKGACPKCKHAIEVPKAGGEVKVHTPEEFAEGGRSTAGKLLIKPLERQEVKLQGVTVAAIAGGALTVLLIAWLAGEVIRDRLVVRAIGLLLVSPPLVAAAYWFLRNDELEPHRGVALYVRGGICSVVYIVLWGVYAQLVSMELISGELWVWMFVIPPFLLTGALVALACLDLDFGNGFFHYAFYLLVTLVIRWAAGMEFVWNISAA